MMTLGNLINGFHPVQFATPNIPSLSGFALTMFDTWRLTFVSIPPFRIVGLGFIFDDLARLFARIVAEILNAISSLNTFYFLFPVTSRCRGIYGIVSLILLLVLLIPVFVFLSSAWM